MKTIFTPTLKAYFGAILLAALPLAVSAETGHLTYQFDNGNVLSADFSVSNSGGGDRYNLLSLKALSFAGMSFDASLFSNLESFDQLLGTGPLDEFPVLSISGDFLNLFVSNPSDPFQDFFFARNTHGIYSFYGPRIALAGASFPNGGAYEFGQSFQTDPARYSFTVGPDAAPVPEASTFPAALTALVAMGGIWFRARRNG